MISSRSLLMVGALGILAVGLAVLSLTYVRPTNCQQLCDEPQQAPCPTGACRFGEQRAGFPLPIVIDDPGGGSPTGGWGKLGAEDLPNPFTFLVDVAFYAALLWIIWCTVQVIRERKKVTVIVVRQITKKILFPLVAVLAIFVTGMLVEIRLNQSAQTASDLSKPQTAILGNWRLASASGREFIFRFYDDGRLSISPSGSTWRDDGLYQWVSARAIRISFEQNYPLSEPYTTLCTRVPILLKGQCHSSNLEPASALPGDYSFPGKPTQISAHPEEYPSPFEPTLIAAYPAPTLIPMVVSRVEVMFDVSVNGNALTLTDQNGAAQAFQRVVR